MGFDGPYSSLDLSQIWAIMKEIENMDHSKIGLYNFYPKIDFNHKSTYINQLKTNERSKIDNIHVFKTDKSLMLC